jgi:hypothetical protein
MTHALQLTTQACKYDGWAILSAPTRHGLPPISPDLGPDAQVIRTGAFIDLFLTGVVSANWTDECWHFARCHSQRLKARHVTALRTAIHDSAFSLFDFFRPAFSLLPFALCCC